MENKWQNLELKLSTKNWDSNGRESGPTRNYRFPESAIWSLLRLHFAIELEDHRSSKNCPPPAGIEEILHFNEGVKQ